MRVWRRPLLHFISEIFCQPIKNFCNLYLNSLGELICILILLPIRWYIGIWQRNTTLVGVLIYGSSSFLCTGGFFEHILTNVNVISITGFWPLLGAPVVIYLLICLVPGRYATLQQTDILPYSVTMYDVVPTWTFCSVVHSFRSVFPGV